MRTIRIATRASQLALWQARSVQRLLEDAGQKTEIIEVKTTGDKILDRPLAEIGGKGLFVKELEVALLDGRADCAVHSLKDLPAQTADAFDIPCHLRRDYPGDVLITDSDRFSHSGPIGREDLGGLNLQRVATGSPRRTELLKMVDGRIEIVPIRGNIQTRLDKFRSHGYDGLILAEASIKRLDLGNNLNYRVFDPDWFVPAAAQGIVAVETLADSEVIPILAQFDDRAARRAATVERRVLFNLGADCTLPVGVYLTEDHEHETLQGFVVTGGIPHSTQYRWPAGQVAEYEMAEIMAKKLKDQS